MTTIQYTWYKGTSSERTEQRLQCDHCQKVIGVDVYAYQYWEDFTFDAHICYDCRQKDIVFCQDCMKPHPKKQAHKITCSECHRPFTATIEYPGLICPRCLAGGDQ